jgi:hypothetical protein
MGDGKKNRKRWGRGSADDDANVGVRFGERVDPRPHRAVFHPAE